MKCNSVKAELLSRAVQRGTAIEGVIYPFNGADIVSASVYVIQYLQTRFSWWKKLFCVSHFNV